MPFKIKDLMINDLSEPRDEGPIQDRTCNPITRGGACLNGSALNFNPFDPSESLESLVALKEQLKQQIAQIERQQALVERNLLPQTVEEVDALAAKLNAALDELRALRARLSSAATQPGN